MINNINKKLILLLKMIYSRHVNKTLKKVEQVLLIVDRKYYSSSTYSIEDNRIIITVNYNYFEYDINDTIRNMLTSIFISSRIDHCAKIITITTFTVS